MGESMDSCSIFLALLFVTVSLAIFLFRLPSSERNGKGKARRRLPPGPLPLPIIGNIHQLGFNFAYIVPSLRRIRARYGPVFRLYLGNQTVVFITSRDLAHQALVQMGAALAGRPLSPASARIVNLNQHSINSADYGPLWRLFRRNLMAETLNPGRTKAFSEGRRWVMDVLRDRLQDEAEQSGGVVAPIGAFHYAMFCLLLFMCFGEKLDEVTVRKVENPLRDLLVNLTRFNLLGFFPWLSKIFFRRRWHHLAELKRNEVETLLPLIRARLGVEQKNWFCYADSLLTLEHPEGRRLSEGEIATLCGEFLNAGTDTTSTVLQWVMANLVRSPKIQAKLYSEVVSVVGDREEVAEEELTQMPYLKAVILEALRRHSPGQLLLPHAATEEGVSVAGYHIPKNATVNFVVGDMALDEEVWKDPMEFRPERFMPGGEGEDVDITGTTEVKMIPFGAGRRICPGMGLAVLHLQYYVANLVREFEWSVVDGEEIDLTEKVEFTVVMKHPLRARLAPRNRPQ
ncbi:cytochrome P450 89A2-like [Nymphaea colorata]|uniref:Cytochrome P450 n=1 Tax=Nymphaea colorata TaxID=210225 RepID=A0A5K1AYQ0_9MAGN|nr:cytochrome P450 89A2-like [Nymphaea colorata]